MTGSEWRLLTKENKVFELLEYQNNIDRHTPVYDTVKKVLMAALPTMKQFDATAWAIYDAIFETANKYFRIKLFLLEIRLDGNITTSFIHNSPDDLIQEFIKLPKKKRDHINKLAERRMKGEKI